MPLHMVYINTVLLVRFIMQCTLQFGDAGYLPALWLVSLPHVGGCTMRHTAGPKRCCCWIR